jgi:hypothetical protein
VVYGNDLVTKSKDGAKDDEMIFMRSWDASTQTETELTPIYDERMPQHNGNFTSNGLSMITGFKESSTGLGETVSQLSVEIFPNPATDEFTITLEGADMAPDAVITMIDSRGTSVKQIRLTGNTATVEVADLQPGIYLVKIPAPNGVVMKKVIIR